MEFIRILKSNNHIQYYTQIKEFTDLAVLIKTFLTSTYRFNENNDEIKIPLSVPLSLQIDICDISVSKLRSAKRATYSRAGYTSD